MNSLTYPTKQEAEKVLEERRKKALEDIKNRGDTVISDKSFVVNWNLVGGFEGYQPKLIIWTESFYKELAKMNNISLDEE